MTNLCDVCGKPATQSMLRDLFGKSDEMRFVCGDHGFRIRDPADVAAIEQLHAAVKTAQELAATRLMEIERLRDALKRVRRVAAEGTTHTGMIAALGILVDRALNPGNGPLPPDYTYHSHEPSEQRSEVNSIDDVAAICHSVTGLCCHILGSPGGPCTIGNCAAVRGYLGGPEFAQGASRDASPYHVDATGTTREPPHCPTCDCGTPADLVGALQDVVHTDPGPVRAAHAVKLGVFAEILSHHPDCSFHSTVAPATPVCDCGAGNPPPCECLVRDKEPSAYHNVKCPRYVADKL